MPHAETDSTSSANMSTPMTNGEKPNSLFISHLTSYPVVSDGITTYKSNPYGAKSISMTLDAYKRFFVPVEPYLKGPYSYIAPYLAKADTLGDKGLSELDSRVPIVKEETASLKEKATGVAFLPLQLGAQGKDYLFKTFEDEKKKTGEGLVPFAKAVLGTEVKVAADTFQWLADFLSAKKEEAKKGWERAQEKAQEQTTQ
ncbi:hypothetical protein FKW77_008110 [Venturia effusa]|uniref:CAP20 n=1 Tax=Venturia effusa TaxID=50376 RepID=A0A517L7T7_9PEZI|nr:hypothetical protein FKW77_008110 [Venturia effusa]